jgi:hypothetical protein
MNRYELRLTAAQLEKLIELLHDTSHDIGDGTTGTRRSASYWTTSPRNWRNR